jgi:hypothetical protein
MIFSGNLFKTMKVTPEKLKVSVLRGVLILCCGIALASLSCKKESEIKTTIAPPEVDLYKEAEKKVEEARGEPVGRKARITIPAQLRHYAERRRFLAIQHAAWSQLRNEIPQGYLELLELIQKGGLVEMQKVGDSYILYGVGEMANTEPFSYYDAATGENITLYEDYEEFERAQEEFENSITQRQVQITGWKAQTALTTDRGLKKKLMAQIKESEDALSETFLKKNLSEFFYKDLVRREMLFARFRWLTNTASNFKGQSYDIRDPSERRRFKMRLLSFIRPEARAVILEIAAIYKENFGRHLPLTSLVRTTQYQSQLRETNANAANVTVPPHSTGLAFDIFNAWMTAEEQNFLMNIIAKFESVGRLEALRENRDHIHVFAFADGTPPDENRVAQALK